MMTLQDKFSFRIISIGLISFTLLAVTPLDGFSQSWITLGQSWEYLNESPGNYPALVKYVYEADTLVEGHLCQQIQTYRRPFNITPEQTWIVGQQDTLYPFYTYNSGDSVFYKRGNNFHMMFDFGAQPGDTWKLFEIEVNPEDGCDSSYVIVDSVGTTEFAGQPLRWIKLRPLPGGNVAIKGRVYENFGAIRHFLIYEGIHCSGNFDYPMSHPLCYYHPVWGEFPYVIRGDISFFFNGESCDFYEDFSLGLRENKDEAILILFPQPANGIVSIRRNQGFPCSYKILDASGRALLKGNASGQQWSIDISGFIPGAYYLELNQDGEIKYHKMLIN